MRAMYMYIIRLGIMPDIEVLGLFWRAFIRPKSFVEIFYFQSNTNALPVHNLELSFLAHF